MIEFNGDLYGEAKIFFLKQAIKKIRFLYLVVFTYLAPIFLLFAYRLGVLRVFWVYPVLVLALCLFVRILLKTGNKDLLIKQVYVDGKYIYSVTRKQKYTFKIKSVKKIIDYGDFYFIAFSPFLPISDIVCQKDLLSKGSLDEFEKIFHEKITNQGTAKGSNK